MVNYGQPSRGCQTCKSRRIKCDLTRPTCQRCITAGRHCPGVPTESDILFRNHTNSGKKRSKTSNAQYTVEKISSGSPSSGSTSPDPDTDAEYRSKELVVHGYRSPPQAPYPTISLTTPFEDISLAFYMHHYVPDPAKEKWMNPWMQSLRGVLPRAKLASPVHKTVSALSMASLSQFPDLTQNRVAAEQKYLTALKAMGKALRDPEQCKSNEVLVTTVLMGLYENMASNEGAVSSYQYHMNGAVAIVRNRGPAQLEDPVGLSLFRAVRIFYLLDCAGKGISLGSEAERTFWLSDAPYESDTVNDLYVASISIPSLREGANRLLDPEHCPSKEDVMELIGGARKIDTSLLQWSNSIPDDWICETLPCRPAGKEIFMDENTWPGVMHTYNSSYIARTLNDYRNLRIYVQDVITRCLIWLNTTGRITSENFLLRATLFVTRQLVDEICGSVPYHLGLTPGNAIGSYDYRHQKMAEALGAFYLVRPLYVASVVECISEDQRRWLKSRLRMIDRVYGFRQAGWLSTHPPQLVRTTDSIGF